MKTILAIDQSTSATKAVLFGSAGQLVDKAAREHKQIYPQPGWVEHDAEEIWQNVLAVMKELLERQNAILDSIVGLSITNQRETCVVFERGTGHPLHNAIVWQCRRGDAICQSLRAAGHEQAVRVKTGLKLDTYFSGSKLKWMVDNVAGLRQQLETGDALIGTVDAYLIYRLTGGKVFATDYTNASRTLLFDIGRLQWDDELCSLFEVPRQALPEVRESFSNFGETSIAAALPKPLPIFGVMGDSQASLFAQCCHQPGMAKATFGTGTSVLLNIGGKLPLSPGERAGVWGKEVPIDFQSPNLSPQSKSFNLQTANPGAPSPCPLPEGEGSEINSVAALAWVLNKKPTYALEGLINYSSATIAWLKDQLGLIRDAAETESLAAAVPDNGGVYLVPAFAGLSASYWSNDARAAIVGMSAHSKKEHVVRAALEAIAYQIRDVLDMMRSDAGVKPQRLFADGGPTRNRFLMQFTADITQLEIVTSEVPESSALGAAMAGLLGLGVVTSLADFAKLPRETRCFRPQMSVADVERLRAGWMAAVKRVL